MGAAPQYHEEENMGDRLMETALDWIGEIGPLTAGLAVEEVSFSKKHMVQLLHHIKFLEDEVWLLKRVCSSCPDRSTATEEIPF